MVGLTGLFVGLVGAAVDGTVKESVPHTFNGETANLRNYDIIEFTSKDNFSNASTYRLWVVQRCKNGIIAVDGRIHSRCSSVAKFCERRGSATTVYDLRSKQGNSVQEWRSWKELSRKSHPRDMKFDEMKPVVLFTLKHFQKDMKLKRIEIGSERRHCEELYWQGGDDYTVGEPGLFQKAMYGSNSLWGGFDESFSPPVVARNLKVKITRGPVMNDLLKTLEKYDY